MQGEIESMRIIKTDEKDSRIFFMGAKGKIAILIVFRGYRLMAELQQ